MPTSIFFHFDLNIHPCDYGCCPTPSFCVLKITAPCCPMLSSTTTFSSNIFKVATSEEYCWTVLGERVRHSPRGYRWHSEIKEAELQLRNFFYPFFSLHIHSLVLNISQWVNHEDSQHKSMWTSGRLHTSCHAPIPCQLLSLHPSPSPLSTRNWCQ